VNPDEHDALRESEERFRLLVTHIGAAVFMLDTAGNVVMWTPAAERILGYTEAEALTLHAEAFLPPEARGTGTVAAELATALSDGRLELDGWRMGKAVTLWAHVVICPIFGPRRELRGFAQILEDRSELRAAQQSLTKHAAELERSNRDLEAFAAIAAHDLQEPLRKLRTFSDRLKRRFTSSLDPDASALVDRIDEAATRMQVLIEGVLDYARVRRHEHAQAPVDLGRIVAEVMNDLSAAVETAGARVEVAALPTVWADALQMRQVFQNLLSNAFKFARAGVPPVVHITATLSDELWELRVEDNGIGFDGKYRERIFGLFQRLHGRNEYGGSGMGLAICRRIIERHSGTLTAQATPGEGAIFTIRLPALAGGSQHRSET
jgi:PAS domain S-box-containing protein